MPITTLFRRSRLGTRIPTPLPVHVGVVMDGNRRWARAAGHLDPSVGHRIGAEHLEDLLTWCEDLGLEHVTAYVLSADNIRRRPKPEVEYLFDLLTRSAPDFLARAEHWSLHVSGDRTLLPPETGEALQRAEHASSHRPFHLTLAIGYDGRSDIAEGVRRALRSLDHIPTEDDITEHLSGGPQKEIDLVIRTGNEKRLSGFFPWQASRAELFFSQKHWPAFARKDFEQALRYFAAKRNPSH